MPGFPILTISLSLLKLMSIESVMPSNHLILGPPLLFLPSVFPSIRKASFQWVGSLHQGPKVLELQLQHQSLGLTRLISYCPRDSQESSPAQQFESISSSVLNLLYGLTVTSVHDYWKNCSSDSMDLLEIVEIEASRGWWGRAEVNNRRGLLPLLGLEGPGRRWSHQTLRMLAPCRRCSPFWRCR